MPTSFSSGGYRWDRELEVFFAQAVQAAQASMG